MSATPADVTIEELPIPETLDGPGGADFRATVDVRNAAESRAYGTDDVVVDRDQRFPIGKMPPLKPAQANAEPLEPRNLREEIPPHY